MMWLREISETCHVCLSWMKMNPIIFILEKQLSALWTEAVMLEETISITTEMFYQAWDEHSWQLSIDLQ